MTTMAWLMRSQHHVSTFTSRIALPNTRYFTALQSLTASDIDGKDGDNNYHSQHDLLESKLRQLATLNGGKAINPRSPQQVSQLLYNGNTNKQLNLSLNGINANNKCTTTLGPTDKATLQRIISSATDISNEESTPTEKQIQAAKLVLECREIYSNNNNINSNGKSGGVQSESFRSKVISLDNAASTDETDDETTLSESTSSPYINLSTYEQMVMDLFPNNIDNNFVDDNMSIDPYWKGPLLSLTRSTSRSIVRQLHVHCPMGYDPSATALSSLTSSADITTTTTTPVKRTSSPLLSYIRHQKVKRPDCIMLVRVGDFYETYGIDAILLVENCGLNAMAGRAKAGCPKYNIQATLDGLTRNGYRVAVYEEWNGVGERPGGDDSEGMASNGKLKTRYLQQVVSSASPTYMYGLRLKDDASAADDTSAQGDDISSSSPGRSYVGVIETANAGYTLVEVSAEERTAVVSERLTAEAVSCRLVAYPPADPMFYVPADGGGGNKRRLDRLPFLPWRQQSASSSLVSSSRVDSGLMVGKVRMKTIPQSLVVSPRPGLTDIERAKQTIVSAFLRLEDDNSMTKEDGSNTSESNKRDRRMVHDDFVVVSSSTSAEPPSGSNDDVGVTATHPLHLETATQLGLIPDPAIPPLISALLPDSAPAASRRFLRRWLLIPPPPDIADAMSQLVKTLKDDNRALPSSNAPPLTGKVISLIRAAQASAAVYCEILSALDAASEVLLLDGGDDDDTIESSIVNPLMKILHHDTGIDDSSSSMALRKRFLDAMKIIEGVVSTQYMEYSLQNSHFNGGDDQSDLDIISNYGEVVPPAFFERNEAIWRGRVKPNNLDNAHRVPLAARNLAEAIAVDFYGVDVAKYDNEDNIDISDGKESTNVVVQDIFNNILAIKSIPKWIETKEGEKSPYYNPHDRNGKILRTRYTTARVQEALSGYVEACSDARTEVETVLAQLSYDLVDNGHLSAILQASHFNLILKTAAYHAASSNSRGWNVATIYDDNDKDSSGHFSGLWPYWMDKSESVENTFDLDGLFLLTAPNMSGKSTLMRSAASAALLTNAGLCAPVSPSSSVRRFDFIFVRGASADVPTENKSAFGAEMGDVSSLLRSCGEHSLVFVDEIGRGTSPKDGTSLAGAILETMSASGMSGMFATHLHGILKLPFTSEADARIRKKKMGMADDSSNGKASWTYKIEDGECTNSLALLTASKFGLPDNIIERAEELSKYFDTDKDDYHNETRAGITTESTSIRYDIHRAGKILEDIAGNSSLCSSVHIPAYAIPPPSFERTSCVYILQIGDAFYVGETDSLSKRLFQHRASKGKELIAIAIKIDGGKSAARHVEWLAIRQMANAGFPLISISDGTTISRRPNN